MALNNNLFNTDGTTNYTLLSRTLNLLTDFIYIMKVQDNTFIYEFANTSAKSILKISHDIIGQTFYDIFPTDRANYLHGLYSNVAQTKSELTFNEEIYVNDQHYNYESILTPIMNGEEMFIITVVRDITEHSCHLKDLKGKTHQTEINIEQLTSLIEDNEDCIFTLDLDGFFLNSDFSSENLIGYRPFELVGTSFAQFLPKEELIKVKKLFQQVVNGETIHYETTVIHKNGKKVQLEIKNFPIVVNGKAVGVYGIAKESKKEKLSKLQKNRIDSSFEGNYDFHSLLRFNKQLDLNNDFDLIEDNIFDEQNADIQNRNINESNRIFEQVQNELKRLDCQQITDDLLNLCELKQLSISDEEILKTLDYRTYFTKLQKRLGC